MARILGVNCLSHDSSICLFDSISNKHFISTNRSKFLDQDIIEKGLHFNPDIISFFERPFLKKTREIYSGNVTAALSQTPKKYLRSLGFKQPIVYNRHHMSHSAYGLYFSGLSSCLIFVIDAIGEWDCTTVWLVNDYKLQCIKSISYPYSLGLFYSSFTKLFGLKPNAEEHLLYQRSLKGDYKRYYNDVQPYLKYNLHKGVNYNGPINDDLASSVQKVFENSIEKLVTKYCFLNSNAVFVGGCSLNQSVKDIGNKYFNKVVVPDKPGDVSSSIGSAYLTNLKLKIYE